jgi:hypothetical protein
MQVGRPQQIGVRRSMYDPSAEIYQNLFGLLAGHPKFLRCGYIEFRQHLNAHGPSAVFHKVPEKFYGSIMLGPGASIMRINEDIGVNELNAHGVRPASTG